jgi:putative transposase
LEIPDHFLDVEVKPFVVMPNHIHGIITIKSRGTKSSIRQDDRAPTEVKFGHLVAGSIPIIVLGYKSVVTRPAGSEFGITNLWHSNYDDHIIRTEEELRKISDYIDSNPQNWEHDHLYSF